MGRAGSVLKLKRLMSLILEGLLALSCELKGKTLRQDIEMSRIVYQPVPIKVASWPHKVRYKQVKLEKPFKQLLKILNENCRSLHGP